MKQLLFLLVLLFAIQGCKSSQVATQNTPVKIGPKPYWQSASYGNRLKKELKASSQVSVATDRTSKIIWLPKPKATLDIIGVGDIMMGTNYPDLDNMPPNYGADLLSDVNAVLQDADLTFGNYEGVILNEGGTPKHCNNPKVCYVFRSPEYFVDYLKNAGFDLMSNANNHAGDFGSIGRSNTVAVMERNNIASAGLLIKPTTILLKDGIKYGLAAFSPNTGTVSINDLANARSIVRELDAKVDVLIVSFHGGAEGSKHEHVTRKREVFYGENRGNVYQFAHEMIDAGADIIFGHGPHVTRAIEVYKNRFISYSLGNFCTYGKFNLKGPNGIAPIVKIKVTNDGQFLSGQIIPTYQEGEGIPKIDPFKRVIVKIQELTKKDFPQSPLNIDDSGNITYIGFK